MLDDFFIRALIAGIGVAIVTGPLGCFVVWRRLSYFGDTSSSFCITWSDISIFNGIQYSIFSIYNFIFNSFNFNTTYKKN